MWIGYAGREDAEIHYVFGSVLVVRAVLCILEILTWVEGEEVILYRLVVMVVVLRVGERLLGCMVDHIGNWGFELVTL